MTKLTFEELLGELRWSWVPGEHNILKHEDGTYSCNKLYIEPERVAYKTSNYEINEETFLKFKRFYEFTTKLINEPSCGCSKQSSSCPNLKQPFDFCRCECHD